jgi:ssDNA-binding Zn-finger/Zn-ribbon topoisomerase 1
MKIECSNCRVRIMWAKQEAFDMLDGRHSCPKCGFWRHRHTRVCAACHSYLGGESGIVSLDELRKRGLV